MAQMVFVSDMALFQLRAAAAEWLSEHGDSLNAPYVRAALVDTNPPDKSDKREKDIPLMPAKTSPGRR